MEIRVSGHQLETGAALQDHATERLGGIVDKYFSRAMSSHVTFGKAPANAFACDIVMHVTNGLVLKSHGQAHDAHQSLDQAADKIEKQLRRYKRRLKDHHEQATHAARQEDAAYTIFAGEDATAEEEAPEAPPVIAEIVQDRGRPGVEPVRIAATHRTFRPPRPHAASAAELARHKAFLETLDSPLWAS